MRVNLPMDLLRSFVTIVDTGSMARASEYIFLTQSALSLQMKRLADIIQQPIFQRYQNTTVLTPAGKTLLEYARKVLALNDEVIANLGGRITGPVRIGMVQDFADVILSNVLTRFKRSNPDIQMEIKIANSADLCEMLQSDLLDIALYLGEHDDEASIMDADLVWLGDPELLALPVLPIALMSKPCLFREAAMDALEELGKAHSVVIETPSISVLRAAVESGLAITTRTQAFLGKRHPVLDLELKPLPKISYNLGIRQSPHPAIESLAELIRGAIQTI